MANGQRKHDTPSKIISHAASGILSDKCKILGTTKNLSNYYSSSSSNQNLIRNQSPIPKCGMETKLRVSNGTLELITHDVS
jgi:hypothetical protein